MVYVKLEPRKQCLSCDDNVNFESARKKFCDKCLVINRKITNNIYNIRNKEKINKKSLAYYHANRDAILLEDRIKYNENIDKERARTAKYRKDNKEKIKEKRRIVANKMFINDPCFRLKSCISRAIRRALKAKKSSKNGKSILKYLQYTIDQLKQHIENLFEPWMNWNNHGIYKLSEWNDKDSSTWKWQIDHIIPLEILPYTSMEDENFKKCWSLENLRPLSAKQNLLDGVYRTRHNKAK